MIWRWTAVGLAIALGILSILFWRNESVRASDSFERIRPVALVEEPVAEMPAEAPRASAATREERRFNRYDKDRDDLITRDEYLASRRKAFKKLDVNGDGKLSFDEWAVRTIDKFETADADKSGKLTRVEFATTAVKRKAPAQPKCKCPPSGESED